MNWPVTKIAVRSAIASDPSIATEPVSLSVLDEEQGPQPTLLNALEYFLALPGAPFAMGAVRLCLQGAEWLAQNLPRLHHGEPNLTTLAEEVVPECETPFTHTLLPAVSVTNQRGESIDADYIVVTAPLALLKVCAQRFDIFIDIYVHVSIYPWIKMCWGYLENRFKLYECDGLCHACIPMSSRYL